MYLAALVLFEHHLSRREAFDYDEAVQGSCSGSIQMSKVFHSRDYVDAAGAVGLGVPDQMLQNCTERRVLSRTLIRPGGRS